MFQKQNLTDSRANVRTIQFLCLLGTCLTELFLIVCGPAFHYAGYYITENFLVAPGLLFFGVALASELTASGRRNLLIGAGMVLWLSAAQVLQRAGGENPENIGMWWTAYLLAFPFAAVTRDGAKQKGLHIAGAAYVAASLILAVLAVLLLAGMLPGFLTEVVGWDGARLMVMWHPNITACLFMIGIALCLGAFFSTRSLWQRTALAAAVVLQMIALVLTNCRTSVLMTCALVGGIVFFCIYRGGWRRFIAGGLAAAAVLVVLFAASNVIFDKHNAALAARKRAEKAVVVQEETKKEEPQKKLVAENYQDGFFDDLRNLNGRTRIWKCTLKAFRARPVFLLRGTDNAGQGIAWGGLPYEVDHAHNSWLQIFICFGLPGLLFALYFTYITLRDAFVLMFLSKSSMWQKCVALLALCLLMTGFLEPFLFTGYVYYQFINVFFFLCIGYTNAWSEQLRSAKKNGAAVTG